MPSHNGQLFLRCNILKTLARLSKHMFYFEDAKSRLHCRMPCAPAMKSSKTYLLFHKVGFFLSFLNKCVNDEESYKCITVYITLHMPID